MNHLRPDYQKTYDVSRGGKGQKWHEKAVLGVLTLNGLFAVVVVALVCGFLIRQGMPALQQVGLKEFITGQRWIPSSPFPGYGALSMIVGTLMVSLAALAIAVPWGVGGAMFLAEVSPWLIREIIKPFLEVLAGIPSVVVGFIALVTLAPWVAGTFGLSNGLTALTGALMLGVMALPTIVSISEDAFNAVPNDYRNAALALGATRWQTMTRVTLPAARSGIIAAVMLGFGRAVGETMTVLMATGNSLNLPMRDLFGFKLPDYLASIRTLTATIAIEGLDVAWGSLHYHSLFVLGAMLFALTFVINFIADIALNKTQGGE